MSYEQAFHDGETTGAAEERRHIIAWLRAKHDEDPSEWYALAHVASALEHGLDRKPVPQSGTEGAER